MKSSKKITTLFLTLFVLIFTLTALFACGGDAYTVTFDSNGGTNVNSVTVTEGEKVTAPATPTKEDYVFAGWEGKEGMWDFDTPITSDMTLVAKWEKSDTADIVSVVFDSCGGSAVASVDLKRGTVLGAPTAPSKTGYAFAGWTLDGEEYSFDAALVNDISLKASWQLVDYTITYNLDGGVSAPDAPDGFTVESDSFTIGNPTKTGYSFAGWIWEGQDTPVKDLTVEHGSVDHRAYTASWELVTYAITYDYKGGTATGTPAASYTLRSDAIEIPAPTKADYVFTGWTYEGVAEPVISLVIPKGSHGDLALTANWKAAEYAISYVLDGGANNEANPLTYSHESAFSLKDPAKAGYKFLGWTYEGVTEPTKDVSVAAGTKGELAYTANWEIITYNITYTYPADATSVTGDELKATFTVLDLPLMPETVFTMDASAFKGWYTEDSFENKVDIINTCGDIALYAAFAPATEGLVFTKGDGFYSVTGYTGTDTTVYIPEIYDSLPVSAIASGAFAANTAVTDISVPFGVMQIETGAFMGCTSLKSVTFRPDGVLEEIGKNAFAGCTSLTSVSLPALLEKIGENAFLSCLALKEVSFNGAALRTLSAGAFESCISLESISLPATLRAIGDGAFKLGASLKNVYFADASVITTIGEQAFYGASSLESIEIPASVTNIKASAFHGATSLASITFASGSQLSTLGDGVFYGCDSLVSVAFPDGLSLIPANAFAYSDKLETVTFSATSSLSGIGASAFYNCQGFKSITLPSGVSDIGASAFYYCLSLEDVNFSGALQTIGRTAFYNCKSLTSIELGAQVYSIGKDAFRGCDNVKYLSVNDASAIKTAFGGALPTTIEEAAITGGSTIESNVFAGCNKLHTLTIPFVGTSSSTAGNFSAIFGDAIPASLKTVTVLGGDEIKAGAFKGAASVTNLTVSPSVKNFGDAAFYGCRNLETLTITLSGSETLVGIFESIPASLKTVNLTMPAGTTPTLPEGAFAGSYVETVTLDKRITKIGSSAFEGAASLTTLNIPADSKLTEIGKNAFRACTKLKSLEFTFNTLTIGEGAFAESAIETLKFPEGAATTLKDGAFENCASLKSFDTVAAGVTVIPANAFAGCTALSDITLSDAVTAIGDGAFAGCTSLEAIAFGEDSMLATIGTGAFSGSALKEFAVPEGVALISAGAFENCFALEKVTFAENASVSEIGAGAFRGSALKEIALPQSLEKIQESAFAGCEALTTVSFADGSLLTKISTGAFEGCSALTEIAIPDGVSVIANNTFKACKSLTSVSFGEASTLATILAHAFEGCSRLESIALPKALGSIGEYAFAQCFSLANVSIPEGSTLEEISAYAFYNCDSITAIALPASLKTLGEHAFYTCSALKEVSFADGAVITVIPAYTFANCEMLTTVALPASVKEIGEGAFSGCKELAGISFGENTALESIGTSAFRGCAKLTEFTAPASLKEIGNSAFAACSELASITLSVDIESVGEYIFLACDKLVITINYTDEAAAPATWSAAWNFDGKEIKWVDLTPAA